MRRFLDRLYYASGALGALFILALCALMIAQSVLRALLAVVAPA
jgi:hypothetical protein